MDKIKKVIDKVLYKPFIITDLGVKMRNPYTKDGFWRGWTADEVAKHLDAVKKYKVSLPINKE